MDATPIELRGYCKGDVDALYALDVVCFAPPFRFSRRAMLRFAEAKRARVVIAEQADEVVGFCIVHVERDGDERVGYIVTLNVAVEQRRQGLAGKMLGEMERQCGAEGCAAMALHVFPGNEAARKFYERCGFVRLRVEVGFYGPRLDAEVWSKRLAVNAGPA